MSDHHPVVGSWRVAVTIPGAGPAFINLATLSSDGTVLVAFPSPTPAAPEAGHRLEFWTPAVGSWIATGERAATLAFVALGVDESGTAIGTHTLTAAIESTGPGWSGSFTMEIAGPDGSVQTSVSGTVSATPIAAAPTHAS